MSPEWLLQTLLPFEQYKYLLLFPIAVLEGPIISIFSGFLVSIGFLNSLPTYLLLVCGDLVGDTTYYLIGRFWGNSPWAKKVMRPFGYNDNVEKIVQNYFNNHTGKTLILAKMSYGLAAASQVVSGISRVPFFKFFMWVIVATLPKSFMLLFIGYYAGHSFKALSGYLSMVPFLAISFTSLLVALYLTIRKLAKKFFHPIDATVDSK